MKQHKKFGRKNVKGFTLVELIVAMFVLTIGVLGGMVMILLGMTRDNTNRMDTTATNAAQAVLEQIAAVPANSSPTLTLTDCLGKAHSITTLGNAGGIGAALTANGDVDFGQAAVANYSMSYTVCGSNGLSVAYDVRWRITTLSNGGKLIVVSAGHPTTDNKSHAMAYITPVTLRTIVGL